MAQTFPNRITSLTSAMFSPKFGLLKNAITVSIIALTLNSPVLVQSQELSPQNAPQESIPKEQAKIKKIDATTYQLGEITIDTKQRTMSFSATTEITENLLEYILVNPEGKVHESLFITKASPTNLNVAFKLLGYQENKSLFREFVDGLPTESFQEASDEQKKQSFFKINVSWTDPETKKKHTHNINELVINNQTDTPLGTAESKGKWSYGGSFIYNGKYVAELNRDIIAVFTDRGAVANFTGKGREDDTLWYPHKEKTPAYGTQVTLTITPEFSTKKK